MHSGLINHPYRPRTLAVDTHTDPPLSVCHRVSIGQVKVEHMADMESMLSKDARDAKKIGSGNEHLDGAGPRILKSTTLDPVLLTLTVNSAS